MQPQVAPNQPTPAQVFDEAARMLRMGDLYEAARRAGKLRAHFPDDIPVLTLHGMVLAKLGIHPQALSDLIKAATMTEQALDNDQEENPNRPRIVDQLIRLSVQICHSSRIIREFKAADEVIENALRWDPDRGDAVAAKALLLNAQGKSDEANTLIEQGQKDVLESLPLVLAKAEMINEDESSTDDQLGAVLKELETESQVSGLGAYDLAQVLRLMGMIQDRLGQIDDSFNSFSRAAKLRRGNYDPRSHTMMSTKIIHEWTSDQIAKLARPEESGEKVVLLLGSPLSGTDQLANMLGQIDDVKVVGPLETLSVVSQRNLGARQGVLRPVPFEPGKLRGGQLKEARQGYLDFVNPMLGEDGQRAIDTHPLNIPLAGAAATFLPGVDIVMCRRDPMESTLACFCDEMPGNHPYASDLVNCAGFVSDCNRMLDHWKTTLSDECVGAQIHEIQYADLVKDPKKVSAKLARDMGLDVRATAIKSVPSFPQGPGAQAEKYAHHTRTASGFFVDSGE